MRNQIEAAGRRASARAPSTLRTSRNGRRSSGGAAGASTCCWSVPSGSTTRASAIGCCPGWPRTRAAGGRRGPLHLRLGPRLPSRLPAHPNPARGISRPGTPVLATTATANARVAADVAEQLGAARPPRPPAAGARCSARPARTREPETRGAELRDPRDGWPGWPTTWTSCPGSGIIYTLTVAAADEVADFLRSRATGGGLLRADRGRRSGWQAERTSSTTGSRRWSRRPRWAWASTSRTSGSSCISGRRSRRSRTTSRWGARGAGWTGPRCCCCRAARTRRSGATSRASRFRRRIGSARRWTLSPHPTATLDRGHRGPGGAEPHPPRDDAEGAGRGRRGHG